MYTPEIIVSFVVMTSSSFNRLLSVGNVQSLKFEYRARIKLLLKERCKATAIHQCLFVVYGYNALYYIEMVFHLSSKKTTFGEY